MHSRLLLFDADAHTAAVLVAELARRGHAAVRIVADAAQLPAMLASHAPDVVVINHRYQQSDSLPACSTIRQLAPDASTVVLVAPGPEQRTVRAWAEQTRSIDAILEKPFVGERFFLIVEQLLAAKTVSRELRELRDGAERLANLVPAGALSAGSAPVDPKTELFEAAVLFTDIRDSSRLITQMPPRDFFELLNRVLSAQAARIQASEGSVVKYTGDGVMAIFRGMGRSYLALRCGLELATMSRELSLPYGVGIAQGLVMAGLIGDAGQTGQRRQYDVIGATAHLAARLCAMAQAGCVVATRSVNAVAQVETRAQRSIGPVAIRGFGQAVDCVEFSPD